MESKWDQLLIGVMGTYLFISGCYVLFKILAFTNDWLKDVFGGDVRKEVEELREEVKRLRKRGDKYA